MRRINLFYFFMREASKCLASAVEALLRGASKYKSVPFFTLRLCVSAVKVFSLPCPVIPECPYRESRTKTRPGFCFVRLSAILPLKSDPKVSHYYSIRTSVS